MNLEAIAKVQAYADQYFLVFQKKCLNADGSPSDFLQNNVLRWRAAMPDIIGWKIEKQAEYADYVTNNICELPLETLLPFVRSRIAEMSDGGPLRVNGACAIGNIAKMILVLPKGPEQDEAKRKFAEELLR